MGGGGGGGGGGGCNVHDQRGALPTWQLIQLLKCLQLDSIELVKCFQMPNFLSEIQPGSPLMVPDPRHSTEWITSLPHNGDVIHPLLWYGSGYRKIEEVDPAMPIPSPCPYYIHPHIVEQPLLPCVGGVWVHHGNHPPGRRVHRVQEEAMCAQSGGFG